MIMKTKNSPILSAAAVATCAMVLSASVTGFAGPCEDAASGVAKVKKILAIVLDPKNEIEANRKCMAAGQLSVLGEEVVASDIMCEKVTDDAIKATGKAKTDLQVKATASKIMADRALSIAVLQLVEECLKSGTASFGE